MVGADNIYDSSRTIFKITVWAVDVIACIVHTETGAQYPDAGHQMGKLHRLTVQRRWNLLSALTSLPHMSAAGYSHGPLGARD